MGQSQLFKDKYNYDRATPVMKQYLDVKAAHLECLLLFRMGDFYELFYEDAVTAARVLGIALTKRGKTAEDEIPMCGVPYHALENYMNKLLEDGFKVAICDQLETPEEAKKRGGSKTVVARDVTRIITPGTIFEESLLEDSEPNYLAAISIIKEQASVCLLDMSTSELVVTTLPAGELINEIARTRPNEILLSEKFQPTELAKFIGSSLDRMISFQVDSFFAPSKCEQIIKKFYDIASISAIGELSPVAISSIGAVLEYVSITQKDNLPKLPFPRIELHNKFMQIDASTRRNLEIMQSAAGPKNTLFKNIDHTISKAGSRLLFRYLSNPLIDQEQINHRLDIVQLFTQHMSVTEIVRGSLKKTSDLERCLARLSMGRSTPKDLIALKDTIEVAETIYTQIGKHIEKDAQSILSDLLESLIGNDYSFKLISDAIIDEAPNNMAHGGYIKRNYHPRVKELHDLIENGQDHIQKLTEKYRQLTGVDTLKITHNNVIGLFVDVTTRNAGKISDPIFIHRQSTANSARYTTEELRELESNMVNAKQHVIALEKEIFDEIVTNVLSHQAELFQLAESLAHIDLFTCLAHKADLHNYCRPELTDEPCLEIVGGRHPVIESALAKAGENFIRNDSALSFEERIWLITGPNMSGKSTYLRQNALITMLAHVGSFVPADSARIGITDRIFSRIGAGDDLSRGQSTFMVEMLETAAILAQGTPKSLIILDEVGRGTSTYDGVAIAWSVLEHIHDKLKARCLFATHYHELTSMEEILPSLRNYTIAIDDDGDKITFLHKIIRGGADRSYGIHVAELAGLPKAVIRRAGTLLKKFESDSSKSNKNVLAGESMTMSLFENTGNDGRTESVSLNPKHAQLLEQLDSINPDNLSPKEALEKLYELKDTVG